MIGREDYEERKESRITRYEEQAAVAQKEASDNQKQAETMASAIPLGQPILVGHHSEKGDRAYRGRVEKTFRKSFEAGKKAANYQGKAETASKNKAISGDNPEAVKLYTEKLEKLQAAQERMKAINKAFLKGYDALRVLGLSDEEIRNLKEMVAKRFSWEKKPYPSYVLTNNNAEIRRIKEKIEQLAKLDAVEDEAIDFMGGRMAINNEINRVQFVFDDKPDEAVRALLKSYGFRWAPSEGAWQRQKTINAINDSRYIVPEIEKLAGMPQKEE